MKKIILVIILISGSFYLYCENLIENKPDIMLDSLKFGEERTLEIVSWNIQNFPKHQYTVQLSAEIINAISPDILGLQEIKSDSAFVELVIQLNQLDQYNSWDGYRAVSDEWDHNLAFVYKTNVVEVKNVFEIYQEEDYDYAFPRRPLILQASYKGQEIYLINNHLKAMRGRENELRRKEAVKNLLSFIRAEHETSNIVVLGDLNDELTDTGDDNVFAEILQDSLNFRFTDWEIAADSTADWSYPYWKYRGHIDHILISNELFDEFSRSESYFKTIVIDRYMTGGENIRYEMITDHRPVGLKLFFSQQ
jgi:endonuclease/exonuclease/phosphatase family metal-dependent hydrolase